jgi:hypothetical protein
MRVRNPLGRWWWRFEVVGEVLRVIVDQCCDRVELLGVRCAVPSRRDRPRDFWLGFDKWLWLRIRLGLGPGLGFRLRLWRWLRWRRLGDRLRPHRIRARRRRWRGQRLATLCSALALAFEPGALALFF